MYQDTCDKRLLALENWLRDLDLQVESIEPASSDASFRRYFRVRHADGCDVAMDAPPDKEATEPFVRIAALLRGAGLHTPAVYQQNTRQGFLLLEDLGNCSLLQHLNVDNADACYQLAMDSLFDLQSRLDTNNCGLPSYDRALLQRELQIFHEWFLEKMLGIVMPVALRCCVDECLIESALAQPRVVVHRDYHSRNLMWRDGAALGVIDFQDAVVGPLTYDLVSLLRDCYVSWPVDFVIDCCRRHYQRLFAAGLVEVDFTTFLRWFDFMGLQRHLKAVGIFARLNQRDGKPGYLGDIPRTLDYILAVCQSYPELGEFGQFLQRQVMPIYRSQL